ncbi:MAG: hypothetical protein GX095_04890 [Clostridiales bacterium]|jgi:putative sterol carrier protein|nr:hypothetical protein [Clostridiales bacterium]HOK82150.1 hypothetical protein [Clostridia bacterium]HPO53866.1 hypothetical protein [Clostridia bacterium]
MSARVKAYVNLFAAMGVLQKYVELDEEAKKIAKEHNIVVRFKVKGGPDGQVIFKDGAVKVIPADESISSDVVLYCPTADKFNDVVDGKGMPIPVKGLFKTLAFMGKPESPFNVLTGRMADIMRGKGTDTPELQKLSTLLAFYAMSAAIAQIGNEDEIGALAGKRIPDGDISLEIKDAAYATITKKDGKLTCRFEKTANPRAVMAFDSIQTAGDLINGKADAMSCISMGQLEMKGYIPMLDNLNKVLNLVPKYLS